MKRATWLIIAAVLYAIFGLGLLLVPEPFMAVYGVQLAASGAFMSRILGAALLGFALVFWWGRNAASSDLMTALMRASLVYNVIDLPIVIQASLAGTMNALGWGPVVLHIVLAAGFGYFAFGRR